MREMNELFYQDAYIREFDTIVVSCKRGNKGYEVILDNTAFYPEGGGQPADRGWLNKISVIDVKRQNDIIIHFMQEPLMKGTCVHGVLDWQRRFDYMQQHSGEHILSGIIHKRYGYDNVGFHMNDHIVTVDFNGFISTEDAYAIEKEVNSCIWSNANSFERYPTKEELEYMDYRSKKEITGKVRLVEYPGADCCACCGTHVANTGEIGLMKILSIAKHKTGVRLEVVFGSRAMADYNTKHNLNSKISNMLSTKPYEIADAVEKVLQDTVSLKQRVQEIYEFYYKAKAENIPKDSKSVFLYEPHMTNLEIRRFCEFLLKNKVAQTAMIISKKADSYFNYVIGSREKDMKALGKTLNHELCGRGGGKVEMIQGSYQSDFEKIQAAYTKYLK